MTGTHILGPFPFYVPIQDVFSFLYWCYFPNSIPVFWKFYFSICKSSGTLIHLLPKVWFLPVLFKTESCELTCIFFFQKKKGWREFSIHFETEISSSVPVQPFSCKVTSLETFPRNTSELCFGALKLPPFFCVCSIFGSLGFKWGSCLLVYGLEWGLLSK